MCYLTLLFSFIYMKTMTFAPFRSLGFLAMLILNQWISVVYGQQAEYAETPPFANFFRATDAQVPWEFEQKQAGVNLFTRPIAGEQLREYKFLTLLQTPFDTVVRVMTALESFDRWLSPTVKDWRIVRWESDTTAIVYFRADLPAPVRDQDVVLRAMILRPAPTIIQVAFASVSGLLPEVPGVNRVPRCNLSWNFRALPNGFVGLSYLGSITPGGIFPAEFATNILLKVPFENVDGLRNYLVSKNQTTTSLETGG